MIHHQLGSGSARRVLAVAWCAVVLGTGTACGVPHDDEPRVVPVGEVPYGLLQETLEPTVEAQVIGPEVIRPQVYFVDADDRLVGVHLPVDAAGADVVGSAVLEALVDGPTADQRGRGLSSSLGPGVRLDLIEVEDALARVEVSADVREPAAERLPFIAAEIVLSLTSVDGIEAVVLERDGTAVPAPLPGGGLRDGPVTMSDYDSLLAGTVGGSSSVQDTDSTGTP